MGDNNDAVMEPPLYFAEEHIFDIDFHPNKDMMACTLINGWVKILGYDSDDVKDLAVFKHHTESTRSCSFSPNGLNLVTGSKDKSISVIDTNGKLSLNVQKAHKHSVNLVKFLNEDIVVSGDDNGAVKVWDIKSSKCVFEVAEQTEAITGITMPQNLNYLLSSSQDGTLAVYDIRKPNHSKDKLYALSDCMDEDLTAIAMVKNDKFVATSTSEGIIMLFKWDWFGNCKDRILFNASTIDHMVKIDESTLLIGSEDGFVRGVSVYPNKQIGVLGQHEEDENFPITRLGVSHCKRFAASLSHDSSIKFYDISEFVESRKSQPISVIGEGKGDMNSGDSDDDSDEEDEETKKAKMQRVEIAKQRVRELALERQKNGGKDVDGKGSRMLNDDSSSDSDDSDEEDGDDDDDEDEDSDEDDDDSDGDDDDDSDDDGVMEDESVKKPEKQSKPAATKGKKAQIEEEQQDNDEEDSDDDDDDSSEDEGRKRKNKQNKNQKRQRLSERAQKNLHNKNKITNFFSDF